MTKEPTPVPVISRSRLEMLVDGIFAIAMTILVLELKVPELLDRRSVHELAQALAGQVPTFVSYVLSFSVLGIFWYRHNQHYHHFRVITRGMLVLHFVELAAAASFPFCAALFGRATTNPLSLLVYTGCICVYAWASCLTWIVAKRSQAMSAELTAAAYRRSRRRSVVASVIISMLFLSYMLRVVAAW